MSEDEINLAGLSQLNKERLLKLLAVQENSTIETTNQQSRYARKWFLFIATLAISLSN